MSGSTQIGAFGIQGCEFMQEKLFRYLGSQRIHPAILLIGPDKQTKYQVAKGMAKFLLCHKRGKAAFCGSCSACRRIEKEIHPDVFLFKDDSEESFKIEMVREVVNQMNVSPIEGLNKVCVIEEAHRMNSGAANAFLKTLEEPGEGRYFILTSTQSGSLLPTLLSRCIEFTFRPEKEQSNYSEEEAKKFGEILTNISSKKNTNVTLPSLTEKEESLHFLQFLQIEIHKSLVAPHLGTNASPYFAQISPFALTLKFEAVLKAEGRLRSNANYGLMIESLLRQHFVGA